MKQTNFCCFDSFLEDAKVYEDLEKFWCEKFWALLDETDYDRKDWVCPYYNTEFVNGTKMLDGNPIFSAKSLVTEKIIRIIQSSHSDGDEFTWWVNKTMDSVFPNELVVVCTLNQQNFENAIRRIVNWVTGNSP